MIRIIVRTDNAAMAANIGGPVESVFKTFDADVPELSAFLRQPLGTYEQWQVVGVEIVPDTSSESTK